jgi:hypothetical protein
MRFFSSVFALLAIGAGIVRGDAQLGSNVAALTPDDFDKVRI